MYLCYADDSGADKARTVTGLLVDDAHWSDFLFTWLNARAMLTKEFGVLKHAELHATQLAKGRGSFCGGDEDAERSFTKSSRLAAYRIMLNALGRFAPLQVVTVGASTAQHVDVYGHFIDQVDRWAVEQDTRVLMIYDGKSGEVDDDASHETRTAEMEQAWRDHRPYRLKHRGLELATRRIIEDVIVQDSRSSQLIQAADLVAYAAYQHWMTRFPELWPKHKPVEKVCQAYRRLEDRWMPGTDDGVIWVSDL